MPFSKRSSAHSAGRRANAKGVTPKATDAGVRSGTQSAYEFDKEDVASGATIPIRPVQTGYSRYNATSGKAARKRGKKKRKTLIIVLAVIVLLIAGASAAAALYVNNLNSILKGSDAQENAQVADSLAPAVSGEPFYMLLLGCDDRDGVEGARSDTTILARIDPGNAKVTLLSIPRDTAINYGNYGTVKFNAAYAYDGASGTIDATSALCGVKISHYAEVHFDALVDLIDYMGGVEVDVPMDIDDADAGGSLKAGKQTLNGEQAMIFARSRSYASGDFQRTTNQRLLIEAMVQKLMKTPATDMPGMVQKLAKCVTTDYDISSLVGLASKFQSAGSVTMYSALMPSTTATSSTDGGSYVVANVQQLAQMMKVIDEGGDPSTVATDDSTVSSSAEAQEKGTESYVNTGDGLSGA